MGAGLQHLLDRVGLVEDRVRALVVLRRTTDPAPDDPFRGLYLSEETVDRLLSPPDPAALPTTCPAATTSATPPSPA